MDFDFFAGLDFFVRFFVNFLVSFLYFVDRLFCLMVRRGFDYWRRRNGSRNDFGIRRRGMGDFNCCETWR